MQILWQLAPLSKQILKGHLVAIPIFKLWTYRDICDVITANVKDS